MYPWYKIVNPRKEVREARSFNPDEFAIDLDKVVAGKGPDDYRNGGHKIISYYQAVPLIGVK